MVPFASRTPTLVALLPLVLAGSVGHASAQNAVVLSGGGARGIAHAGVIRAIDSLGVDPDLVVGSSMGAIVGALYASGLTGRSVWETVAAQDLSGVFGPLPTQIGAGPDRFPVLRLEVGRDRGSSKKGLLPEWGVNRLLTHLLFDAGARARGDFDRLPRRFRAVAGDLDTGAPVVIADGDLAQAVRASMAIPGAFAAMPQGDRLLVDGGIANYLPIGTARSLGARWVLASDVIRPTEPIAQSSPVILGSRGFHWLNVNARDDTARADVTISPALSAGLTAASFMTDLDAILAGGYESALEVPRPPPTRRASRQPESPPLHLSRLIVSGAPPAQDRLLRSVFDDAVGAYDAEAVLTAMDRAYATGLFDAVWPWVGEGGSRDEVPLRVRVSPRTATQLSGGGAYEVDRGGRAWMALQQITALGNAPVVLGLEGQVEALEKSARAGVELHVPAWAPARVLLHAHVRETTARDAGVGGAPVTGRRAGGGVGIRHRSLGPDRVLTGLFTVENVHMGSARGVSFGPLVRYGRVEPLGAPVGTTSLIEGEARFGTVDYWRARGQLSRSLRVGVLQMAGVAALRYASAGAPVDVMPALGDDSALPGARWGEERGRGALVGGVDAGLPLPAMGTLRLRLRAARLEDPLDSPDGATAAYGAELGALWVTPFGAMEVRGGGNSLGSWRLDFAVGSLRN